ncbi:MAG TPA: hypothetical protein PL110_18880 [Candidatus Eremiobacteraeota bacterium]|nr:MAG: hypothetical protein BWY64_02202 [bacterium ADurb.Bin363]HPZ10164.1 hypothetical protein [Candidatus Eremiobacteraeota bacterium]
MSDSELKGNRKNFSEKKIGLLMIMLTGILVSFMFFFSMSQNVKMPVLNSVSNSSPSSTVNSGGLSNSYISENKKLTEDYKELVKKVQDNLKGAHTAHQQQAISSYYSIEAMELLLKQNTLIIEQNEKIIHLLTEIRDKK